ncbi:hypothetical protein [Streptococcus parauberis]|uniref:hypothetical protein n=1 Tax=Streptococcus parauberis TaxID=1348 RepID=UPI0002BBE9C5|nr:hypothetical protein [Streptococcus parauberis]EMF49653.1 hypothetical protein SPJ2_0473 [Streptococcus parauberis KRS-02109]UWM87786.1 hypothetical protein N2A93_04440 [Streptococcus parauberis]UWM89758.1 hypothetical protein N2A96_04435 [Streptococcus parauberis]
MKKSGVSFGHSIGSFFGFIFSGLMMILGFLIATTFFILSVLINWVKMSLGFALFWFIASGFYNVVFLDNQSFEPFDGMSILIILGLGFIASVYGTISDKKN